jgi:hypothetical protein
MAFQSSSPQRQSCGVRNADYGELCVAGMKGDGVSYA